MPNFENSSFVWAETPPRRNGFVSFEKTFVWTAETACRLHLFADTRYRLWVNETFVAHGPGRFVTAFPEYDSHELDPWLTPGENRIRVEVNYYGTSSYQSMPDGMPGFIAAGGTADGTVDFSTPGDWRARVHEAWDGQAPLFSFAQNPLEICDTRRLQTELADDSLSGGVRVLSGDEAPWRELTPRSVPQPDYAKVIPETLQLAAPVRSGPVYGFQSFQPQAPVPGPRAAAKPWRRFATWLHAEQALAVDLECFWSDLFLNGQALEVSTETSLGNHGVAHLRLSPGWNLLEGRLEVLTQAWSYPIRLPAGSGLRPRALPDMSCEAAFALSPVGPDQPPVGDLGADPGTFVLPAGWTLNDGDPSRLTPARIVAWDQPETSEARRELPADRLAEANRFEAPAATWVFRFDREYHGQPTFEVEAPAGAILDIAYDDWDRADGCVNLYGSNPFTDAADRFILRGGRQRIHAFNPRGGIFLQVTLRAPKGAGTATLQLHEAAILRRTLLDKAPLAGHLSTGDADFDFAWETSVNTLRASTDEAYTDCPWRERGSYIGDSVVTANLHGLVDADLSVGRRTYRNFGLAALPDGQLACCAPAWLRAPHEDFTYCWILGLRDLWARSGDTALLEENWSALEGIWAAPWECHPSGLWNADGRRLFIDWGVDRADRTGEANAVINLLRLEALRASGELARARGLGDRADAFADEAAAVEKALLEVLWLESEGRFRPSLSHDGPALHANILALRFGVGDRGRLLHTLEPRLRANFRQGIERGQWSGHAELYFLSFLLPALGEVGAVDLAEQLIVEHYGFLRSLGHTTLAECFCRAHAGHGSLCHTWSAAGAIYAHRYVLGLRQLAADDPDHWILEPRATERFREVSGALAHPRGTVRVRWKREAGRYLAEVAAPEGLRVEAGEGVDIR